jgi:ERF superfamily
MNTSEKIDLILPALMKVKSKLQAVTKSANNPFFKSKYADLNTYLDEVEPLLEENKMVLFQPVRVNSGGTNTVSSIIMHESGQFISSEMVVVTKEADMQKLGSAITYARRYTLGPLLSMKAEDDDGNGASGKAHTKSYPKKEENVVNQQATSTTTVAETKSQPVQARASFKNRTKTSTPVETSSNVEDTSSSGDDI